MAATPKRAARLPPRVTFQLATRVAAVPDTDGWIHELKLDGYRIACVKDQRSVRLVTRGGRDWTPRFPGIVAAARALPAKRAWLDGEVVIYDARGVSRFEHLQAALEQEEAEAVFVAFDLLHLDDRDLRDRPLLERKKLLARLLGRRRGAIRYLPHSQDGCALLQAACEKGAEGVVSKRATGRHEPRRSRSWVKVRCDQRQEVVVGGYTDPRGSRADLGALLVGVYDGQGRLRFAGKVGSGFDVPALRRLRLRLDGLRIARSPFVDAPASEEPGAHWARPVLVAEVRFTEWTKAHRLRHPVFVGLREDKPAREVVRERVSSASGL